MHPTGSIMSYFSIADFTWREGYLTTQRDDFTVKISSTKIIFNFSPLDRLRNNLNYAKLTAKFIAEIADECFINNSEIFITHFISKSKAYVEVEHADFGHTNFDIFMRVFNGNPMIYPQVDLCTRIRLADIPTDFQYLMDICDQYCELFPIREETLNRIEQVMMNKKYRESSWPIRVRLNEIKEFIDRYAVFPNCDEILIDKEDRAKSISYTRKKYRGNPSLKRFDETTEVKFEPQVLSQIILQRLISDKNRLVEEMDVLKEKITHLEDVLGMCIFSAEDYELYESSIQKTVHFQDDMLGYGFFHSIGLGKAGLGKFPRKRVPFEHEPSSSPKTIDVQASSVNGNTDEVSTGKEVPEPSDDPWRASDLQSKSANNAQSSHSSSLSNENRE